MHPIVQPLDGEPVPSSMEGVSSRTFEVMSRYESAEAFSSSWRQRSRDMWRTYAGKPLSDEDMAFMESSGRPVVSYNISLGTINAVLGADMAELKEPKFSGVDTDVKDHVLGEWLTNVVRHCRIRSHGHDAEASLFTDQLVTGLGGLRGAMDNSRFPFRLKEESISSTSVYWDPAARDVNFRDRNWHIIKHRWSLGDAIAHWPNKAGVLRNYARDSRTEGASGDGMPVGVANNYGPGASTGGSTLYESMMSGGEDKGTATSFVEILEYEYIVREPWVAYQDPFTGEDVQMSRKDFRSKNGPLFSLQQRQQEEREQVQGAAERTIPGGTVEENVDLLPPQPPPDITYVEFPKKVYRRAWFVSAPGARQANLLEDKELPYDRFSVVLCTGFLERDERGRMVPFGLMSVIDDPQKYAVKILSSILEMLRRQSKGGMMIKPRALLNPATFMDDIADPGKPIYLSDDADVQTDIFNRPAPQWPQALERFFDIVLDAIPEVSGVTRAFKGTLTQERSNVLIQTLNTQSTVMLQPVYRPLNEARKDAAFLLAELVVRYLSDDYINKILGPQEIAGLTHEEGPDGMILKGEDGQPVPILNEEGFPVTPAELLRSADVLEYDVEVDVGSASPTARRDFWRIWVDTNLLGQLSTIPGFPLQEMLPILFKYMPLPAEEAARLAAKMEAVMGSEPMERAMELIQQMPPEQVQELYEILGGTVEGGAPGGMMGGGMMGGGEGPPPGMPPEMMGGMA